MAETGDKKGSVDAKAKAGKSTGNRGTAATVAEPSVTAAKPARSPKATPARQTKNTNENNAKGEKTAARGKAAATPKNAASQLKSTPTRKRSVSEPVTKSVSPAPEDGTKVVVMKGPKTAAQGKSAAASRARKATHAPARSDTRTTTRKKTVVKMAPVKDSPTFAEVAPPQVAADLVQAPPVDDAEPSSYFEAAFGLQPALPEKLALNIERIEALTRRLLAALSHRRAPNPGIEVPGPELFANATAAWMRTMAEQPARIIGQQVSYWGETLRHLAEAQAEIARGSLVPPQDEGPKDRRFGNPLWDTHPFFNFIKRQYQINAEALQQITETLDLEDEIDRRRVEWFTRQMIDMMSPTNFLATNPDALEKAIETEGESLVKGLENLVRDVEQHGGDLVVSLADRDAFSVGENIATTEGTVIARTSLYELIQYKPTTDKVHAVPVVIFPPWINKFYIMDLKPQNSLIKWIVDQGFTLFVVAWRNPGPELAQTGMDDYVASYLEVMDRVRTETGQQQLNLVGYCIAGTTLALTLALMKKRGDDRVNSATFFTTLTDFSDQGEFTAYLQDDFVSGIEDEVATNGVLSAALMQRTFSFLRANDLVWGPAIRSYMLGETPPAFDLLYWNGDGTNLPGRMAVEYLRGLCQQNAFARDGFTVGGQKLRLADVTLPLCAIACETDHIAPWKDSWRGIAQMGSADRRFILSESGHIAGIINPPSKKKYGHYTSDAGFADGPDTWREKAEFHSGSWWGGWSEWLSGYSGDMVDARQPKEADLGAAPGSYVHERP